MAHLVIGSKGQVGSALIEVLAEKYEVSGIDINESLTQRFDVLHICIPYNDRFEKAVRVYLDLYLADGGLIIIHSTVPVGTSAKFNAVHSPIRGVHPHLADGIRRFEKYFGGPRSAEAGGFFNELGIECVTTDKAGNTEAMKLWDTTYYGWNIVFEKAVKAYCDEHGLNFDIVYTRANQSYNEGYATLGMEHVQRPVLKDYPGALGGHCIQNNAMILHEAGDESGVTKKLLAHGQALKEGEKPVSNRAWLYCEYWGKEKSTEDIGKELGCTGSNVLQSMRRRGIERRDVSWTVAEDASLVELSQTNTFKEIAGLLGKTHNAVRLRAISLDIESCYSPAEQTKQEATRRKISCTLQGITESEWGGFKESVNALIRKSEEYQNWRKSVFERDGYNCTSCKAGGFIHAHHIKEFAKYPELRFDINNGVTLCVPCHKLVHKKKD